MLWVGSKVVPEMFEVNLRYLESQCQGVRPKPYLLRRDPRDVGLQRVGGLLAGLGSCLGPVPPVDVQLGDREL
jgi:hypothetical protein